MSRNSTFDGPKGWDRGVKKGGGKRGKGVCIQRKENGSQ